MRRRTSLTDLQDRLAALLGCAANQRPAVVANMLRRSPQESTGYWLQLRRDVDRAPDGPDRELRHGLAVGSPFLVVRSGVRILLSVALAVVGSALITSLLPSTS